MSLKNTKKLEKIAARIARIQEQIRAMDYVASGTILKRMKVCGKPGCRCASDSQARHGPYYEWGRMKEGKLVHQSLSPEQAQLLKKAIANYKKIRALLRTWESETVKTMEMTKNIKSH